MTSEVRYTAFKNFRNKLKNTFTKYDKSHPFKDMGAEMKIQIKNLISWNREIKK